MLVSARYRSLWWHLPLLAACLALAGGCGKSSPVVCTADACPPGYEKNPSTCQCEPSGPCVPSLRFDDPYYREFEGTDFQNACRTDADCVVSGCGGEVCAAESVASICIDRGVRPTGSCACVQGYCVWSTCSG